MPGRMLIMLLGAGLVLGCDRGEPERETVGSGTATVPAAEQPQPDAQPVTLDLFTGEPPAAAQILYVGDEDTRPEGARSGSAFVPMSTFSVERDGIPNEFPPADSMADRLEAAGVRGEHLVIVGKPIPAGRAWAALDYLGLGERAALFEGDAAALDPAAQQVPPAHGAAGQDEGGLELDVREEMIVDAEWVRDRLDDPGVAILDARPPAQFSGQTPGDGIERPGHIPGARNLFWETLVQSPDTPLLRDEAELRRIFEEAGVGPGDTVVAYCRTGGQGSFLYTVARHLGYDARLYDGSYVDWSRTDYPVETGTGSEGEGAAPDPTEAPGG